jgi:CheY-like chemotaxis protein
VAQAARICGTPISLVSLIDADRQWFKAKVGLEASQTPREQAFCAHAIADPGGMLVVTDTHTDARFSGNPLVLGEPRVRFYAGIALRGAGGDALGTLCVIDHEPRKLNAVQLVQLEALAEQVSALIQLRVPHDPRPGPTQPWAEARTPASPVAQASSLRLLVVDDEKALCELACEWFESMGYRTSSALSAAAALELLATEPFDILFTDIVMPGMMDGLALAKEARLHYPNLRVVLASGYAQALGNDSDLPGSLVSKPYRKADLIKALA